MPEYVNPVLAGHRLLICPVCRGNAPPEGHVGCCLDGKRPEPVPYVPAAILDALDVLGARDQFGRPVRDVIERAIEEGL